MFPPHPFGRWVCWLCGGFVWLGLGFRAGASAPGMDAPEAVGSYFNAHFPSNPASLGSAPATLSLSTLFSDLATLTPALGLMAYDVNSPAWADGAEGRRWLALPNSGGAITAAQKITNSSTASWLFPIGTVVVKHFDLPINDTNTTLRKKVETQVLVLGSTNVWYALTYRWRDDESDADLQTSAANATRSFTIPTGPSTSRTQVWTYQARANCLQCHSSGVGSVLGINTHQLNRYFTYPRSGRLSNELHTLNSLGFFTTAVPEASLGTLPKAVRHDDFTQTLENRARSYLDANCACCHRAGGPSTAYDLRLVGFASRPTIINALTAVSHGVTGEGWVRPAAVGKSMIHYLANQVGASQMPPLGKSRVDTSGMLTLAEWINSLSGYTLPGTAGLSAKFYNGEAFNTLKVTASVTKIDNDWAAAAPAAAVNADAFSASWGGYLYTPTTGVYTINLDSDDGVQLWLNNSKIVDSWPVTSPTRMNRSGFLNAIAGQYVKWELQYHDHTGNAVCKANWSGTGITPGIIPPANWVQSVTAQIAPPLAVNDSATLLRGTSLTLPLTSNDTDYENNLAPATLAIARPPTKGTLTLAANGSATYFSSPTAQGATDDFLYTVNDATGLTSNRALVSLTLQTDYGNWRNLYFTAYEQTLPTLSAWTADPDRDGLSNLLEYATNTNPRSATSRSQPLVTKPQPNVLQIRFAKRPGADLLYDFQLTTDPANWPTAAANVSITENASDHLTVQLPITAASPHQFLRMRATLLP